MSDAKIRELSRIPISKMTLEQVLTLDALYSRLERHEDSARLWFAYNQSLPPLPVIVRRWETSASSPASSTLIAYFPTQTGSRIGSMEAISRRTGSFEADYNWELKNTRPTNKEDPRVLAFVAELERLDGRRCKIVSKVTAAFDRKRLDDYYAWQARGRQEWNLSVSQARDRQDLNYQRYRDQQGAAGAAGAGQ